MRQRHHTLQKFDRKVPTDFKPGPIKGARVRSCVTNLGHHDGDPSVPAPLLRDLRPDGGRYEPTGWGPMTERKPLYPEGDQGIQSG